MRILLLLFIITWMGCDTGSKAKPYATLTQEEKAREALDAQDYETAIELYKELIEAEPEAYERYRYLAAAYASSAGFDIIDVAKGDPGGGSGSLLDALGGFLPADPSTEQLESMALAKDTLLAIPAELRSKDNTEVAYASGAAVQLEFYQSAYTIMYINRFAQVTPEGQLDPARLESMSDDDVSNILNNFSQVAATGGEGVPAAAQNVLNQIDQQEGETQREKLINYLNANKK
jgi:hypothetical protein